MLTLSKYKRFIGADEDDTAKDEILQEFIDDAVGEAERATNRKLRFTTVKAYYNGNGKDTLILNEWPVYRVTKLQYWNGSEYKDILNGSDTLLNSIRIIDGYKIKFIKSYTFDCGNDNIYVEFEAGFLWADEWKAEKAYLLENLVVYNNSLYKCTSVHTSGETFDVTKWDLLTVEVTPRDLEKAIKYNATVIFYESPAGKNLFAKTAENTGGQSQKGMSYNFESMREYYEKTYAAYRKQN